MLDEEMDHIIREAAENHHPPYNDKAWDKMALQLDKHLPQKKDRKRSVFFLLLFLLLGGAGTFFVLTNRPGNEGTASQKNNEGKILPVAGSATGNLTTVTQAGNNQVPVTKNNGDNINSIPVIAATGDGPGTAGNKLTRQNKPVKSRDELANNLTDVNDAIRTNRKQGNSPPPKALKKSTYDLTNVLTNTGDLNKGSRESNANSRKKAGNTAKTKVKISNPKLSGETQTGEALAVKGKPVRAETASKLKVNIAAPGTENGEDDDLQASLSAKSQDKKAAEPEIKAGPETVKKSPVPAEDKKLTVSNDKASRPGKKKPGNKFSNNFGLTVSVGPDMSFVKLNNTGKTTLTYGAGLSYDLTKRFTARAGFYVSKKIYQATPGQYHNSIYRNLTSVDANCKVFEIPISLIYNFGLRNKHNWFGAVGLYSFIMKKEDYVYNYKTATGQTYTYNNSISNENKHFLSVLNLSGGYKYQFSGRFSLQAEPYLQVPLSGVGLGKIKLNSAGVLFTATYKPFKKKK